MKKTAFIHALVALSVMPMAGCAQDPAGQSAPGLAAKPVVVAPAQEASLRKELRAIDPTLDTPHMLPDLVLMCKTIQRGMPEQARRDQAERIFFRSGDRAAAVPARAADRILKVITTNGFCQT